VSRGAIEKETPIALILRATAFAAEKHRNQRRNDQEASPYINHPIALADGAPPLHPSAFTRLQTGMCLVGNAYRLPQAFRSPPINR
jgi:hypothetical protein